MSEQREDGAFSWPRVAQWTALFLACVVFGFFAWAGADAWSHRHRVLPGVHVGDVGMASMDRAEIISYLRSMSDRLLTDGVEVAYGKNGERDSFIFYPMIQGEGNSQALIDLDEEKEADRLLAYGKEGNVFSDMMAGVLFRFQKPRVALETVSLNRDQIRDALVGRVGGSAVPPGDARILVASVAPLSYTVIPAVAGIRFQYDEAIDEMAEEWSRLERPSVVIPGGIIEPSISSEDVQRLLPRLPYVFQSGPLTLRYTDPRTGDVSSWTISLEQIREWLMPERVPEDGMGFGLDEAPVTAFLERTIGSVVNEEPLDAKFRFDEATGKVIEFQGSRAGLSLDTAATYATINNAILERSWHDENITKVIPIVTIRTEPAMTTGEANTLGITDILGTGVSNFAGSPKNRIANILNAVKKLNGILVQPDEEFSTLSHLQPFTAEAGYLPELVIKGDRIKPEIGGGLCQIGTTLFRMAMQSAMPITQRRNHSLVVQYYSDPRNGMPGTDATIYEPAPDFRFKNDTGHSILIQTEMDIKKAELRFTIWGQNDGRKGSYTAPKVSKWYGTGEERRIETDTIEPGKVECQHEYRGADASFTYTRILADGTKEDTVYTSHYRPLPKICLVGVEKREEPADGEAGSSDPALPSAGESVPVEMGN